MATLTKGYTFGSTELVTNTKLSSLVDSASISGIVNTDVDASAAIAGSKLDLSSVSTLTSGTLIATNVLTTPGGVGGTTVNATGEITVDTTTGTLNFFDGAVEAVIQPIISKSITVEEIGNAEDISMYYVDDASTIVKMVCVLVGSDTPSVTWTIRHGIDRSAAGAEVTTGGDTTTSITGGSIITSFDDATMVADSFIWLETTAQSGTVLEFNLTIFYRQDA